jgi:hypothetical protein
MNSGQHYRESAILRIALSIVRLSDFAEKYDGADGGAPPGC